MQRLTYVNKKKSFGKVYKYGYYNFLQKNRELLFLLKAILISLRDLTRIVTLKYVNILINIRTILSKKIVRKTPHKIKPISNGSFIGNISKPLMEANRSRMTASNRKATKSHIRSLIIEYRHI